MAEPRYDPQEIEPRWRAVWEEMDLFRTDLAGAERPCYALVMLPYPSGDRLHVGHWYHYGPSDSWARFMRMRGFDVFEPIGFDAFGLPAENYAVRTGIHPRDSTEKNVANMIEQLRRMGAMWDWSHTANTSDPAYYRWTQWIFLRLYEAGLAYRATAPVWWCPTDQTVLANEQVVGDNECERCGTPVVKKDLTQWFFKITAYADELLGALDSLEWPSRTKALQRNWIGRSEGVEIAWPIDGGDAAVRTFTTRPDTIYGVTFLALAPEHVLVDAVTTEERRAAVEAYRADARRRSEIERTSLEGGKTGVDTGARAIHPLTGERIPVWVADFVLATYGTGAIQGVPAHDERDHAFVRAVGLPEIEVIDSDDPAARQPDEAYTGHGTVKSSGPYDGMRSEEMIPRVIADLEAAGKGEGRVHYRLRDWLLSRQRYWGAPIPIVHCERCGEVPVAEEDLPVELPYDVDFSLGAGKSPLERSPSFMETPCPRCGGPARRDADTMDTFVDSTWYYLRYLSPDRDDVPWDRALADKWVPVYQYSGGIEHATLHLLYSRFMIKALRDLGHVGFDEPFRRLVHQGTITAGGAKMSKSRGNVVSPDDYISEFGADAFRAFLMFGYAWSEGGDWKDDGVRSMAAWLQRVWRLVSHHAELSAPRRARGKGDRAAQAARDLELARHRTVKAATEDLERWEFHGAIARVMELVNALYAYAPIDRPHDDLDESLLAECLETLVLLMGPIAPHLAEELWSRLGHEPSVVDAPWPAYDESVLRTDEVTVVIQVNGKVRDQMQIPRDLADDEVVARALAHGRIPGIVDGSPLRKSIVVANRLVNLVI